MPTKQLLTRLQWTVWIVIYGGLLSIVLARFVGDADPATATWMTWVGAVMVAVGVALIYLRSRLVETPDQKLP
jgi:hypothetical protein